MKRCVKWFLMGCAVMTGLLLFTPGGEVFAAEEAASNWRPIYDQVMRWLNFIILVFILVKFGRGPISTFLHGRKDEISKEIKELKREKEQTDQRLVEMRKSLEDSEARLATLKERIISRGEKKKSEIIENARLESRMMMEDAKRKISASMLQAKARFKSDLVDAAMAMALEQLPGAITADDNQRFINEYIESASR
ncbi:MAG: ATP synthase F0 subunit B [Desulfobacterales bacterium]|nr:ATP synthase F0 subunit B [Desulfobacterales bacterium]